MKNTRKKKEEDDIIYRLAGKTTYLVSNSTTLFSENRQEQQWKIEWNLLKNKRKASENSVTTYVMYVCYNCMNVNVCM